MAKNKLILAKIKIIDGLAASKNAILLQNLIVKYTILHKNHKIVIFWLFAFHFLVIWIMLC